MGELDVKLVTTQKQLNDFTQHLLKDIEALERMLEEDWFDRSPIKIGAEQEMCIVDQHFKPAPFSMELLEKVADERYTTEIAKFNIEANFDPLPLTKSCFSELEKEIDYTIDKLRNTASELDLNIIIAGILPTIRKFDLGLENLTPLKRYDALIKAIDKLRGKIYELKVTGIDELNVKHDSALLEACNTSFQVHLQVNPEDFVRKYNLAQAITAPVLAIASNSPLLFGKRLWSETRVALFTQSVDTRVASEHLRDRSPRVTFGNQWLRKSVLEIYREDITRFRVMLMAKIEHDVMKQLDQGVTPKLKALTIHNSTVYRWNRPCYGISPNGKPHLRIENRCLPAGPSVIDEVANAAFWIGLMNGADQKYKDVTQLMSFEDAKSNFISAARSGMDTELTWMKGNKIPTSKLISEELLPLARKGLEKCKVHKKDIDRYLGVIEERNASRQNGTQWALNSFGRLIKETKREEVGVALSSAMLKNQKKGKPVHQWKLAGSDDLADWQPASLLVEEFMTTDIFTVHKDDIPELAADIMDWQRIRYIAIEDDKGKLIGLITNRILLRYFAHKCKMESKKTKSIKELMVKDPISIAPEATIMEAMDLLKKHRIGCIPVVKNHKLVGIIVESDFLNITDALLRRMGRSPKQAS